MLRRAGLLVGTALHVADADLIGGAELDAVEIGGGLEADEIVLLALGLGLEGGDVGLGDGALEASR